jgi:hypothetical protein
MWTVPVYTMTANEFDPEQYKSAQLTEFTRDADVEITRLRDYRFERAKASTFGLSDTLIKVYIAVVAAMVVLLAQPANLTPLVRMLTPALLLPLAGILCEIYYQASLSHSERQRVDVVLPELKGMLQVEVAAVRKQTFASIAEVDEAIAALRARTDDTRQGLYKKNEKIDQRIRRFRRMSIRALYATFGLIVIVVFSQSGILAAILDRMKCL